MLLLVGVLADPPDADQQPVPPVTPGAFVMKLLFGLFLVAHGLVHVLFMIPRPPDTGTSWPFDPSESWLLNRLGVEPDLAGMIAAGLVAVTVAAFVVAALTVIGILPASWLRPIAIASASVSLILLGVFFHPWLVLGIAIDAAILWGVGLNGGACRAGLSSVRYSIR